MKVGEHQPQSEPISTEQIVRPEEHILPCYCYHLCHAFDCATCYTADGEAGRAQSTRGRTRWS